MIVVILGTTKDRATLLVYPSDRPEESPTYCQLFVEGCFSKWTDPGKTYKDMYDYTTLSGCPRRIYYCYESFDCYE
jgi:hypothetical protein